MPGQILKRDDKGSASHGVLVSMQLHLILVGVEVVYEVFCSVESFYLQHYELCWEREVQNPDREWGFRLLYQSLHLYWGPALYGFLYVVELLLDASETLFPRLCSPFRLAGDWIVAFVVPTLRLPVVVVTSGSVGVMLLGLAIFSFSVNVSRGAEVLLFILWNGVVAFTGLL